MTQPTTTPSGGSGPDHAHDDDGSVAISARGLSRTFDETTAVTPLAPGAGEDGGWPSGS